MALAGWLAGRRGRDDGLWAVIGLFIGPLAVAALLILPRRRGPDPLEGMPEAPATHTGDWSGNPHKWPVIVRVPPVSPIQRILGSGLGGAVGAAGAWLVATRAVFQAAEVLLLLGAASGVILGYILAGSLIDAERMKVIGVGLGAGVLALSVAGLLIGIANVVRLGFTDATTIIALSIAVVASVAYPITYALFSQGVFAVAILGGLVWAAATHVALRQAGPRATTP